MSHKEIWKFTINPGHTLVVMPLGAEILTAQIQGDALCLWALVDPNEHGATREFEVFGTGHQISCDVERKYISTVQIDGGSLVFHLFEIIRAL